MKNSMKRTAVAALAGVMAAGMLTGCGEQKVDGTKTVATVNKTEIPLGVVSLYARIQQAQTDAMYKSFMGSGANMWDTAVEEGSEETYGQKMVSDSLKAVELMVVLKEKAADYGVEVTEEEQAKIADAAAAFVEANGEEVMSDLAATEDQIKMLLELQTYRTKLYDPIVEEGKIEVGKIEVTDEEANQSAFTYINVSADDEMTEEEKTEKKEQAQEILDKVKEDPAADMTEIAKETDDSYTSLKGTFTTVKGEETEDIYPEEVMEVLRTLKEGEVNTELIESEGDYYIVRLDKELDEDATESKRESLKETKESEYYQETCDKWLEEADVKEEAKVLKTLTVTNAHSFVMKMPEAPAADDGTEDAEAVDVETEDVEGEDAETENPETTDEAADAELEDAENPADVETGDAETEEVSEGAEETEE